MQATLHDLRVDLFSLPHLGRLGTTWWRRLCVLDAGPTTTRLGRGSEGVDSPTAALALDRLHGDPTLLRQHAVWSLAELFEDVLQLGNALFADVDPSHPDGRPGETPTNPTRTGPKAPCSVPQ